MKRTTKYVALDVHQATTAAAVGEESGGVIARTILPTEEGAIVMRLCGMRTRSIFDRYNIGTERRRIAAVEGAAGLLDAKPERKVAELR